MTELSATARRRGQGRRYVVPVIALVTVAMLGAALTLAASTVATPSAQAQLANTTCYTINDGPGTMTSWTGGTQTLVGDTTLTAVEALAANQDRNELWTYDNATQAVYSFTPGSATPTSEFAFTDGDIDGLTWVNHNNGDTSDDQLWGTFRNPNPNVNNGPNDPDQIVRIAIAGTDTDPTPEGTVVSGPTLITDPGAGTSNEQDDNDGLIWDPSSGDFYGVIGGDTTANDLIIIDPTTGSISLIVLSLSPGGGPILDIESLGAGTDGQLYGTTGEDGPDANQFVQINKITGVVTIIGAFGGAVTNVDYEATACLTAVPFSVTPATCYVVDESSVAGGGADDGNHLVQVDIAADGTPTFTDLGLIPNAENIESIAYRNGFEPYALYTVDPSTGDMIRINIADGTDVQIITPPASLGDIDGLTFRNDNDPNAANDEMWGVVRNAGDPEDFLVEINPTTGALISSITIETNGSNAENDVDGLAWDPATDQFFAPVNGQAADNELITINRLTGAVASEGLMGVEDVEGMGFTDAGELFGSTGASGPPGDTFLFIDKNTGAATQLGAIPLYSDFESLDCAGVAPVAMPDIQIRLDVIPAGDTCPVDFASATEGVGTPLPVEVGDDVTYCFKVINNGPGDATDVTVSHPALGTPIVLGDIAAGGEAMDMVDDTVEVGDGETTATVTANDAAGSPATPDSDPAAVVPVQDPVLDIRLDVIPAGDTCPVDFASATEGVGTPLPVAVGDDVTYCFKVINNGPGDAQNVTVNHPALGTPINLGSIAAGGEAMDMVDDTVQLGDGETTATVDGENLLGTPVAQAEDPAAVAPVQAPDLDIRLDVIPAGDTCPVDFASATEGVGTPLPVEVGDDVTYCFKVINNGPGDAQNVTVNHPALGTPINLGSILAGGEAMDMVNDTVEVGDGETTATVDGETTQGTPVPQAEDPAAVVPFQDPVLDIRLDVIPAGDTCPVDFASATEGVGTPLPVALGDQVTYCFKVINNGPGDAQNVVVNHPLIAAPINLGDIAAGGEAMDMEDDTVEVGDGETTATVDGENTLGAPVVQAEDPAAVEIIEDPVLDIRLDVIPAGDICPVDFASATEGVGPVLPVAVGDDVTYCFKVINNGPGDAQNVTVNHPALGTPIVLGDIAAGGEAMDMVDDTVQVGDGETTATVDGENLLGTAVAQAEDPAAVDPIQDPVLDIRLDIIPAGDTCPVDFASATEGVGPVLPVAVGDDVTYCFKVINNGPGDAQNVTVNHPALGTPIVLGDIAAGGEAMDMVDDTVQVGDGETTATVDGQNTLGTAVPQAEDPAAVAPVEAPVLDIRLDVIPAGDTCPVDFASATEGVGTPLPVEVGDDVTYCFKVINTGPGDATNVTVNHPALGTPIVLGDIAAGGEAMDMVDDTVEVGDGETTATVDGQNTLGTAVPQADDPAAVQIVEDPVLDIRLDVIPAGDTCPVDFASATEGVGTPLPVEVGDDVTYCFKVINNGPGDAQNVTVNHPALGTPINLGSILAGGEAMDMVDDTVEVGDGETTATVDGQNTQGTAVAQAEDPAAVDPFQNPALDIRLDVIPAGDTCPVDFASATEGVGTPLPVEVGDDVTYCFKVINNGPGDAQNVTVNHPALGTPIVLGDIAAGGEAMDMVDDTVEVGDGETTATVDGQNTQGTAVPQAEDPAAVDPFQNPALDIRLDVIPAGDTCPVDFASATEGVGTPLPVAVGDDVTYCFKVINNGPGDAQNVTVNHPALGTPIVLGDIAAGGEAMDMVDDTVEVGDALTSATVDGQNTQGTAVPQADDPAAVAPVEAPVLDIRLDVIPAGDTCPVDFASATEGVGTPLTVEVGDDVTYCFKVINTGPGDAQNVTVNHPALGTPINLGDIAAGGEAMDMVDDTVEVGDGETTATVDGQDLLGNPVGQAEDPAAVDPFQNPVLDIRLDVIPAGDTCPVDFASATEGVGPVLPVAVGDDVTYCFKVINNGPGDATNVTVNHPALGTPIVLGDIAAGGEAMDMVDDTVEVGDGETTATVDGQNTLGTPVPQAEDPAAVDPIQDPVLDIRLDVIPAGDTCPVDFASATEGVGTPLPVAVGDDVTYCFKVINNGPGDATNVTVNHPALGTPIVLGDIAAGGEAMDMVDDTVEVGDGETTATVDGQNTLGTPVPQAEDPAAVNPVQPAGLDIRLDVIPAGDTCPVDFASATEGVGTPLPVSVGDDVTYCFKVINTGPGDVTNVIVNHPALGTPINLGDIAAGGEAMDMVDDTVEVGDALTSATVDGTDGLGQPVPQAADPAAVEIIGDPVLDIRLDVIPAGDTCPVDFASATEGVGTPLPVSVGDDVTYCFKVINTGPSDAQNVTVNHPALGTPIVLGDIAAGGEAMDMVDDTVEVGDGETTATVDGQNTQGAAVPQAEDPAAVAPVEAPVLDIRLDVIPAGDTCPVDFASATEGVGPVLPVAVGDDVTYCFKVINNGPGDATNVTVNHPALGTPIVLGDIAAGGEAMDMVDDTVEVGDGETTATVDGQDTLGTPVPQAEDPAAVAPVGAPVLDIRLDVIPAGDTCPVDFASATEGVGTPLPVAVGDDVTYCFKVINTGPGDAQNVTVNHPALGTPIVLGDIAAGGEAMDMVDDTVEVGDGETTATVDGQDTLGTAVPQAEDPAAVAPVEAPVLDIRLDVIPAGDTCPVDFASATEGVGTPLTVEVGDDVTYCFKVINTGPGDAQNVTVNHPALGTPINLGDIAAGGEAMDMVDDTVEVGDGETTATVDGQDLLGNPVGQAEDPAAVDPFQNPVLDIRLDVIPAGDTCPVDFASATEGVGPVLPVAVGDDVTYCFKVINNGPGDAQNVTVNHPALGTPIVLGDIAAGGEAMDMVDDTVEVGDGETTATVDGNNTQGTPVPQAEDPAAVDPVEAPSLDIRLDVIPAGDTCPVDFASATEGVGPVLPVAVGDDVTYCFKVINSGPGDVTNVIVNHPALGTPINLGDIAAGGEAMDMVDDTVEVGDGETTATVDGTDGLGQPVPQAEDPAAVDPIQDPVLDIRLDVIPAGDTCPVDYASATEGVGTALLVAVGDDVTYCFKVINNGPGDAQNVTVNHPALGTPIVLGDIAAGGEAMDMVDDTVEVGDGETTATVDGDNTLGTAVPQAEDPAAVEIVEDPVLDIRLDVIPAGGTCPVDFASATEGVGPVLPVAVGDDVTYCFKVINTGPGDAQNVTVNHPALGTPINLGDIAAGGEAMDMVDDTVEVGDGETTATVDGDNLLGAPVPQAEDPAAVNPVQPAGLDIRLDVIPAGDTCPVDFASATEGVGTVLPVAVGDDVTYCFKVINTGPGDVTNVIVNHPALGTPINLGDIAAGSEAMDMVDDTVEVGDGATSATVDGTDGLGQPVPQAADPAEVDPIQDPVLDIRFDVIPAGDTCPVDFASATEGVGTVLPVAVGDDVTYCFKVINNGPGDAQNVIVNHPDLLAPINLGDIAAGAEAMDMDDHTVEVGDGETTATVDGQNTLGTAVPQADDPAAVDPVGSPLVDIRLDVIPAGDTCPADFASATEGDGTPLAVFVGDDVTYCFKVINNGPDTAQNVTVNHPALGTPINLGDIAAGGEAMDMVDDVVELGDAQTTATVDAQDRLGNAVPQEADTAVVEPSDPVANIGDFVWRDNNRDGIQDSGEPGIEGVTVTVWSVDTIGELVAVVATLTTDDQGAWGTPVPPGDYRVAFALPAGAESFSPLDAGADDVDSDAIVTGAEAGFTGIYTVANGDENLTIDAGIVFPVLQAKLGDFVWEDQNADGVQDTGEPGIGGVLVEVRDTATNNLVASATTDAVTGMWMVDVDPGTYTVTFINTTIGDFTVMDAGTDDAADSDADPNSGLVEPVTVGEGAENLTIDAGIVFPSPAIGLAKDVSAGPTRTAGTANYDISYTFIIENLGDVDLTAIQLTDNVAVGLAGTTGSVVSGPTVNAAGDCSTEVSNGTQALAVGESCTAVWDFVITNPGGAELAFNNSASVVGTPPVGPDVTDISDVGAETDTDGDGNGNEDGENDPTPALIPALASLGDRVFEDTDGNGVQDAGELGVPDVTVNLLDENGAATGQTTTTDGNGLYGFDNLDAGTYIVQVVAPTGRSFTTKDAGSDDAADSDVDPSNGRTDQIVLAPGANDPTNDAGITPVPAIGLAKALSDGPTRQGTSDIYDVSYTFIIENLGGTPLTGVQLTDNVAAGLAGTAGSVTGPTPNVAGDCSTEVATGTQTLAVGQSCTAVWDFVLTNPGGAELAFDNSASVVGTPPTGPDVSDISDNGAETDTDGDGNGNEDGENDPTPALIPALASLGDLVFEDTNNNGIQDPTETGVGGVSVNLLDGNGDSTAYFATTLADGSYSFDGLEAGTYIVEFIAPTGRNITVQNAGSDDTVDSDANPIGGRTAPIVLAPGDDNPTVDAGVTALPIVVGSISDLVFDDLNGDGIQDAGEPGLADVTVTLLDGNGDPVAGVAPVTTDGNGNYIFGDLPEGAYIVAFTAPAGRTFSPQNAGDGTNDSDAGPNGRTPVINLVAGEKNTDVDAGIAPLPLGSISDSVFDDLNGDGIQDPGEAGVAGVTVTLLDGNGDPVAGVAPVTTDGSGNYIFNNLPAGNYIVAFTAPDGRTFTTPNAGGNDAADSDADPTTGRTAVIALGVGEDNVDVDAGLAPLIPAIGIAKALTAGPTLDADGDYTIEYSFVIENLGATALTNVGIADDFDTVFGADATVSGPTPISGTCDATAAFAGTASLAVGESCTAVWSITVSGLTPGETYNNTAVATGTSPSGETVEDTSDNGTITDGDGDGDADEPGENDVTPVTIPVVDGAILGDKVFIDGDGDGVQDPGESPLPGVAVQVFDGATLVEQTTTDSDGLWRVEIEPGTYTVNFIEPTGSYAASPQNVGADDAADSDADASGSTGPVTLEPGDVNLTVDAGFVPLGSLGNRVFLDANNNGIQDAGEGSVPGAKVQLYAANADGTKGALIGTEITGADGSYLFTNLPAGGYIIVVTPPAGFVLGPQDAGADDDVDNDVSPLTGESGVILVGIGQSITNVDAGVVPAPTLPPVTPPTPTIPTSPSLEYPNITNAPGQAPAPVPVAPEPPLALTGSNSNLLVTFAIVMLAAGATMLIGGRREQDKD